MALTARVAPTIHVYVENRKFSIVGATLAVALGMIAQLISYSASLFA